MANQTSPAPASARFSLGGRYLTLALGKESYGIDVLAVREILRITDILPVSSLPSCVEGVIHLRGKVIQVIDLRSTFGIARIENTERTCIVIVQIRSESGVRSLGGLVVDAVEGMVSVPAGLTEKVPGCAGKLRDGCILGQARLRQRTVLLLDVNQVARAAPASPSLSIAA